MAQIFNHAFEQKLIYVYRINDIAHEGILKIGEASCNAGMAYFAFAPNCRELNEAAKERIRHQMQTAGVSFELLYTEATAYMKGKNLVVFQDHEVHDVLTRSGIKRKVFDTEHKANEWFYTDLETVRKAIVAVKEGRTSLSASEISTDRSPVVFRPEQTEAIEKTIKQFKKTSGSHQMLWNAKMRFGKTLSTLEVVKRMNYNRTLILTLRPVVDSGWFEDYGKIFYDRPDFYYFSNEFETAIHTSAMTKISSWILKTCKRLNVQLFMTTHSKEALQKVLALDSESELKGDITLFTLYQKDGRNVARRLSAEKAIEADENFGLELR